MKEEENFIRVRSSRKVYFPVYLMILILVFTIGFAKFNGKEVSNLALRLVVFFSAACIAVTEIHRLANYYEINSGSLVTSKGIFSKTTRRVDLISVSDADSDQNVWQRLLNYGDVNVRLFSKESTVLVKNINNPSGFVDFLEGKMAEKKGTKNS
ncbi:PH domain-containing protein [Candidatus Pacearchaeota archaeon]|nr:PH domain-containing protein [Candidatus Pacearchaeota archaeon]